MLMCEGVVCRAMRLVFELSGEHPSIPRAEALSVVRALGNLEREIRGLDQVLVVEGEASPTLMAQRLAMTHHILEYWTESPADMQSILEAVKNLHVEFEGSFRVRVKRVKGSGRVGSERLEREIGAIFYHQGHPVDLHNPDVEVRAIISGDRCIIGRVLASVDRGGFEGRRPMSRPFFYPGVLLPRMARALVNLLEIDRGRVYDPFCGTGGFLIEAGLIDLQVLGSDVQVSMVFGARENLGYYGLPGDFFVADGRCLPLRDGVVDGVITDFPYGRSAVIQAPSLRDLYRGGLREVRRVLRSGGHAVVVSDRDIEDLAGEAGLIVVDKYVDRVHRSLTRRILVLSRQD